MHVPDIKPETSFNIKLSQYVHYDTRMASCNFNEILAKVLP